MSLITFSAGLPANGDTAYVDKYNAALQAIAAIVNGQIDQTNIADNSIVLSKLVDNTITLQKMATVTHLRYRLSASVVNPATGTIIPYDTKDYDTLNEFNTTTHQFTATQAGTYQIIARYLFGNAGLGTAEFAELVVSKNSITMAHSQKMNGSGDANRLVTPVAILTLQLAVGDIIKVIHNGSNGIRDITADDHTFIEIHRVA